MHELDDEALIFDAVSGDTHRLNGTALFIWRECDGTQDARQVAERLVEVYDVSPESGVEHVERMFKEFDGRNLFVDAGDAAHGGGDA